MTTRKTVAIGFRETRESWEAINRRVDGLVFGSMLYPARDSMQKFKGAKDHHPPPGLWKFKLRVDAK